MQCYSNSSQNGISWLVFIDIDSVLWMTTRKRKGTRISGWLKRILSRVEEIAPRYPAREFQLDCWFRNALEHKEAPVDTVADRGFFVLTAVTSYSKPLSTSMSRPRTRIHSLNVVGVQWQSRSTTMCPLITKPSSAIKSAYPHSLF